MERPTKWEDYFHLVEFAYNNGYQASAKTRPIQNLVWEKSVLPLLVGISMWIDKKWNRLFERYKIT